MDTEPIKSRSQSSRRKLTNPVNSLLQLKLSNMIVRCVLTVMSRSTGTDLSFAAAEESERLRITDTDNFTYCASPQEAQDTRKAADIFD